MNYNEFLKRAKAKGGVNILRTRDIFYIFDERYCTIRRDNEMEAFIFNGGLKHLPDMKYVSIDSELSKTAKKAAVDDKYENDHNMFAEGVTIDCDWCAEMLAAKAAKFGIKATFDVDCTIEGIDGEKFKSIFGATE